MFSEPKSGPSADELAAAEAAKAERTEATQDILQRETDKLFRLYGARGALGTAAVPLIGK